MKKRNLAIGAVGAVGGVIAWKFLTRSGSVNWNEVAKNVPHFENSAFIDVDGIRIHFQEFGNRKNPTLLLIHGYTASTAVWKTVAPVFAENGFHVVSLDLVGFGYSEKPSWFDYTIVSQARMVSRFMDRLGIGRATVVGSSYGGAVAATLALDYPERLEKLIFVNTVSNDAVLKHPLLRLAQVPGVGEVIAAFAADSRLMVRHRLQNTLAPANHDLITEERISNILRPLSAADAHNSVLMTARRWDANRIEDDAHLINHPTLIIWGDKDLVIPISFGRKLHDAILHSRMIVFKNCGHVPQEEAPENFVKVVLDFCRSSKGRLESVENESMRLEEPKYEADDINVVGRLRDALKPA